MIATVQNLYSHVLQLPQNFENQPIKFHKNSSTGSLISILLNALRSFKILIEFLDLAIPPGTCFISPFVLLLCPSAKFHNFLSYRCYTFLIRLIPQEFYWFCSYYKGDFFFFFASIDTCCYIGKLFALVHYFYTRASFISTQAYLVLLCFTDMCCLQIEGFRQP